MPPWRSFMFLVESTLLISLRRRCGMELIFYAYKIPSCVLCLTFFSSISWMFISRVSIDSPNYDRFCLLQLLCLLFTSGACIFWHCAHIHYLRPWVPSLIYPVQDPISSVCCILLCHQSWYEFGISNSPRVDSFFCFFVLDARMGGVRLSLIRFLVVPVA